MKTSTINMFAATSEDLPIFSGVGLTELTVEPSFNDLPQVKQSELLYRQACQEIRDMGLSIKQSSWYGESMVVVASCQVFNQGNGHGPCEFVAVMRNGEWDINRYYDRG